jgi:hypothetical protein
MKTVKCTVNPETLISVQLQTLTAFVYIYIYIYYNYSVFSILRRRTKIYQAVLRIGW